MVVHDFAERLAASHSYSDAPWWREVYVKAFGRTLAHMTDVRADGWAQRAGIDRTLTFIDGRVIRVDEKVRDRDYGDLLLEQWSDLERRTPGWVQKPLLCDFIAYAIAPSCTCYLLPTSTLQQAWRNHGRVWIGAAEAGDRGYRIVDAENRSWVTRCVAVPTGVVMAALVDAMTVHWTAPNLPNYDDAQRSGASA